MDYAALWAEIQSRPDCAAHIVPSEPKVDAAIARAGDQAIAELLSAGRVRVAARMVTERDVLGDYVDGPIAADRVLTKLEQYAAAAADLSSVVGRALRLLGQQDGIDIGAVSTRLLLGELGDAGVLTPLEVAKLMALAEVPETITAADVSRAVRGPRE